MSDISKSCSYTLGVLGLAYLPRSISKERALARNFTVADLNFEFVMCK